MNLVFWDKRMETYHRESNVEQCAVTQTIVNGHNRNCYVLYFYDRADEKVLFRNHFELERVEA